MGTVGGVMVVDVIAKCFVLFLGLLDIEVGNNDGWDSCGVFFLSLIRGRE